MANIVDGGQDNGYLYLKAFGAVPTIDIPIVVTFISDGSKVMDLSEATLATGSRVNTLLLNLCNQNYGTMTSFRKSYSAPRNSYTTVDLSANEDNSIVAWRSNGTVEWYSPATTVYMNEDSSSLFKDFTNLNYYDLLSSFNANSVVNASNMFENCSSLQSIDVSMFDNFNTLRNVSYMFKGCSSLTLIHTTENWSASSTLVGTNMFEGCVNINPPSGTSYDSNHIGLSYAHVDGGSTNPGYFADEVPEIPEILG